MLLLFYTSWYLSLTSLSCWLCYWLELSTSSSRMPSKASKIARARYQDFPVGYRPVDVKWKDLDKCNVCHMDEVKIWILLLTFFLLIFTPVAKFYSFLLHAQNYSFPASSVGMPMDIVAEIGKFLWQIAVLFFSIYFMFLIMPTAFSIMIFSLILSFTFLVYYRLERLHQVAWQFFFSPTPFDFQEYENNLFLQCDKCRIMVSHHAAPQSPLLLDIHYLWFVTLGLCYTSAEILGVYQGQYRVVLFQVFFALIAKVKHFLHFF